MAGKGVSGCWSLVAVSPANSSQPLLTPERCLSPLSVVNCLRSLESLELSNLAVDPKSLISGTSKRFPQRYVPFDSEGRNVYPAYLIRGDKIHSQEVQIGLFGARSVPGSRDFLVVCNIEGLYVLFIQIRMWQIIYGIFLRLSIINICLYPKNNTIHP